MMWPYHSSYGMRMHDFSKVDGFGATIKDSEEGNSRFGKERTNKKNFYETFTKKSKKSKMLS